ncbi:TRAP transporter substrate-binding protein [Actinotalea sp. Marseille-Q4924]|uniref:TRAP transporter substrate-binding protein n=1 Tax=Actinotalea sp. Marseille-Q4924 TaxID=2866571 RepID=UPI001CE482C7|nr:hypothetical protein [Actinotalea sp. Marseille-Q4924]
MNTTHFTRLSAMSVVSAMLVAGCSGGDDLEPAQASTSPAAPAELRLAFTSGLADAHVEALQDAIATQEDSGLSMTVDQSADVQHTRDGEQRIVQAVADGTIDLAVVGARVFSQLGAHDLDALVAPMVLTSVEAQEAVWSTDLVDRMLDGLGSVGVTGLAAFPGPVRRPVAAGEPLIGRADFEDVPFFVWDGDVSELTVEALGATAVEVTPEERNAGIEDGTIHAFDNTLLFMADKTDWATRAMSLNVGLWPSVSVLVANPDTLAGLSAEQRTALLDVVEATSSTAFDRLPDEQELVDQACANGFTFGLAPAEELAHIRAAVEPVHERLRADDTVALYLDEIEALTRDVETELPTVPDGCDGTTGPGGDTAEPGAAPAGAPTELDGTYAITWTVEDLTEALGGEDNPTAEQDARNNAGTIQLTFDRGRYDLVYTALGDSCPGTFIVDGDRVVLTATTVPSEWDCGDGLGQTVADAAWRLADGDLTLSDWELSPTPDVGWFTRALLGTKPLERLEE